MNFVQLTHELGYVDDIVPDDILQRLVEGINRSSSEQIPYNHQLVGHISGQHLLPWHESFVPVVDYLSELGSFYEEKTSFSPIAEGKKKLFPHLDFWVNQQKKWEFQPSHWHTGEYSFVVWIKIPYLIEEEFEVDFVKDSKQPASGHFEFIYPTPFSMLTLSRLIPADKSYEKRILFFPSHLRHVVYPFYTSDDLRVSISGNVGKPFII